MTVMVTSGLAQPPQEPERRLTCFAIGPIGDEHASPGSLEQQTYEDALEVYENVTSPACHKHGIDIKRADDLPGSAEITLQILDQVRDADIVIADLSGGNPNVLYELGWRHATGKPTIQIGECDKLPFDVANIRTIMFRRTPGGLVKARKMLEIALEAGVRDGFDLLSPIRIMRGVLTSPDVGAAEDAQDAPGMLEQLALLETETVAMAGDLEEITASFETIAALTEEAGPEVERVSHEGAPMSVRLGVITKFAMALGAPADELETTSLRFADRMRSSDDSVRGVLNFIASLPRDERPEDTDVLLNSLIDLAAAFAEGFSDAEMFSAGFDVAAGLSRQLRKPMTKITSAITRVISAKARIDEWAEIARSLQ